ncbi:MAG: helix-turn-helix domain-containing protein [Gemmatimonadota bacterium]|nr:helix-turn-helix domain-containing protein [Gemmatimonadota bacterium]
MALLSARDAAKLLGKTIQRTYELARVGVLPCVRLGRSVCFSEEILRAWIENGGQALPGGWRREPPKPLDN